MSAQYTALYDETEEKFKATSVAVIFNHIIIKSYTFIKLFTFLQYYMKFLQ